MRKDAGCAGNKITALTSTVYKISTFQKFTNLNALGSKFDLDVK